MKMDIIRGAMIAALAGLFLGGCTIEGNAKYVGGGELPSSGGLGKAYLQVDADTCAGNENARGGFTYTDKSALDWSESGGVALTGTIQKAGLCESHGIQGDPDNIECHCPGWPAVRGEYTSTNPKLPGSGTYYACFYSQREGVIDSSFPIRSTLVQRVVMTGGPYENYENHGLLRGNIQTQACSN